MGEPEVRDAAPSEVPSFQNRDRITLWANHRARGPDADRRDGPLVALISESAIKEFGGKNPIGEKIDLGDEATVVGIVSDTRRRSLDQPPRPAVYLPYTSFVLPYMGAIIRTDRGAAAVTPTVKGIVAQIDPDLPVSEVTTIEQIIASAWEWHSRHPRGY